MYENSRQLKTKAVFAGSSRVGFLRSEACILHMIGMWRVRTGWKQLIFASVSRVRPSCECPAGKTFPQDTRKTFYFVELSYLIHAFFTHTIYTLITHRCWRVLLRENPNHKPWELKIVIPTFLYTIYYGFSSTPTSQFLYPWEVDNPNTYHTHSECQVRFWCCWKALEEAKFWQMQSGVLRDLES